MILYQLFGHWWKDNVCATVSSTQIYAIGNQKRVFTPVNCLPPKFSYPIIRNSEIFLRELTIFLSYWRKSMHELCLPDNLEYTINQNPVIRLLLYSRFYSWPCIFCAKTKKDGARYQPNQRWVCCCHWRQSIINDIQWPYNCVALFLYELGFVIKLEEYYQLQFLYIVNWNSLLLFYFRIYWKV